MAITQVEIELKAITCASCGIIFGVEATHLKNIKADSATFYCPSGHSQWFGEGEADRLKKQLAQEAKTSERLETSLAHAREERDHNERRRAAAQGQLTKTKNRIAKGICPICNRYFPVMHKHMESQHPEYEKEEEA